MTKKADKASSWDAVKQAHALDGDASRLKAYYQEWAERYDDDVRNEQYSAPAYIADLLKRLPRERIVKKFSSAAAREKFLRRLNRSITGGTLHRSFNH